MPGSIAADISSAVELYSIADASSYCIYFCTVCLSSVLYDSYSTDISVLFLMAGFQASHDKIVLLVYVIVWAGVKLGIYSYSTDISVLFLMAGFQASHDKIVLLVYVIVWAGVKLGINITSCSENGKELCTSQNFTPTHAITN